MPPPGSRITARMVAVFVTDELRQFARALLSSTLDRGTNAGGEGKGETVVSVTRIGRSEMVQLRREKQVLGETFVCRGEILDLNRVLAHVPLAQYFCEMMISSIHIKVQLCGDEFI